MICALRCGAPACWETDQAPEFRTRLGWLSPGHDPLPVHMALSHGADALVGAGSANPRLGGRRRGPTPGARPPANRSGPGCGPQDEVWGAKHGRGSHANGDGVGHRLGLTAGAADAQDGHEIAAVQTLLAQVVAQGKVVTQEVLHTHRRTAQQITDAGGDYLMNVKGNQPELLAAVEDWFAPHRAPGRDRASAEEVDTGHGRTEKRWLLAVCLSAESARTAPPKAGLAAGSDFRDYQPRLGTRGPGRALEAQPGSGVPLSGAVPGSLRTVEQFYTGGAAPLNLQYSGNPAESIIPTGRDYPGIIPHHIPAPYPSHAGCPLGVASGPPSRPRTPCPSHAGDLPRETRANGVARLHIGQRSPAVRARCRTRATPGAPLA